MAYNGGCLIGVPQTTPSVIGNNFVGGLTQSVVGRTPVNVQGFLSAAEWPLSDGAFTPGQRAFNYVGGGSTAFAVGMTDTLLSGSELYGVLFSIYPANGYTSPTYANFSFFTAATTTSNFIAATPNNVIAPRLAYNPLVRAGYSCIAWGWPSTAIMAVQATTSGNYYTSNGGFFGEFLPVRVQEMPTSQDLVSYKREQTAPSMVEIKTLDGAIRRAITGPAAYNIQASFKWSDDGTIAKRLASFIQDAQKNAQPLLVYIPQGIYYDGAHIDLVVPTNTPCVTMPAPGVYELTIEGTCQP